MNNNPRMKSNLRIDRACFGIRIVCAERRRIMARAPITPTHATWKRAQKSISPLVASIPVLALKIGGPTIRRKTGYRKRNLKKDSFPEDCFSNKLKRESDS
jgi:hypothetical protein